MSKSQNIIKQMKLTIPFSIPSPCLLLSFVFPLLCLFKIIFGLTILYTKILKGVSYASQC